MPGTRRPINHATKVITQIMGVTLAIAGFHHGFFEFLQGNKATDGVFINSIGDEQIFWDQGTDPAVTLIPNFLWTGIIAMTISMIIIVWSIRFIRNTRSVHIFLLLFVALTLFGGGGGHVLFFVTVWAYATQLEKPLTTWKRKAPVWLISRSSWWQGTLGIASLAFILALEISVFGFVPGVTGNDNILAVCWGLLFLSWIMIHTSYAFGFAHDLKLRQVI